MLIYLLTRILEGFGRRKVAEPPPDVLKLGRVRPASSQRADLLLLKHRHTERRARDYWFYPSTGAYSPDPLEPFGDDHTADDLQAARFSRSQANELRSKAHWFYRRYPQRYKCEHECAVANKPFNFNGR